MESDSAVQTARNGTAPESAAPVREMALDPGAIQVTATAFMVLFCIVGLALWGLPFYYDFMIQRFGWTRGQVTSGNALSKLIIGPVFGFIAGWIVDRFGPRRLMMAGILMAGAALVGLSAISTLGLFYFFYMFNALGYVCGGPLPNQVLLSRWFDKSRGKAMGIAYLGIGLGGAAVPLISAWLVQHFGWQAALRACNYHRELVTPKMVAALGWQPALTTLGLMIIAIALPLAFFVKEPPAARSSPAAAQPQASVGGAFRSWPFYLLVLGSMCSIGAVSGVQQNLKLFLSVDQHYAQQMAARVLSLVMVFSLAGRLLMGWLADRMPKKYVMILNYLLVVAAIPLLFFEQTPGIIYVFAIIFGIGLGGDYMIIPLMTADIFGVKVLGRLMGVILTASGAAEAAMPWLVGHMRDASGSYRGGFLVLVGVAVLGTMAAAALPRRRARA